MHSQTKKLSKLHSPWIMWAAAGTFVFFQFFLQLSSGVMLTQLMHSFHLTAFGAGLLVGSFYIVYVILQTPAGMLVDRFGARRLLAGGGVVCAIGCFLFASSNSLFLAYIGRALIGGGSAFAFVSSLYIVDQWFPENRFALMVGLADTIGMCGTIFGNVFLAETLANSSWRSVMYIAAIFALLIGIFCYVTIVDKNENTNKQTATPDNMHEFFQEVLWIIRNPSLCINGIYSGLLLNVVTVFATLWALPYLVSYQHVSLPVATMESVWIFVGIAVGAPFMGWLYPKVNGKKEFLVICALAAAMIASWQIYLTPMSVTVNSILFLILGIICSGYVFNYTLANEVVAKSVRSTSMGFTNTLCMISAPILQPFIGWLLHLFSKSSNAIGEEVYTISDYHWALSILPITLLIAAVMALYIPNDNQRFIRTQLATE